MYTKIEIKKYKGSLIKLTYNGRHEKSQTGKITALTSDHILFKVNGEYEKPIEISKIISIESIKTFSSSIRIAKSYLLKNEPQKALDSIDEIKDCFNLKEQISEIESLRKKCIVLLFMRQRQ